MCMAQASYSAGPRAPRAPHAADSAAQRGLTRRPAPHALLTVLGAAGDCCPAMACAGSRGSGGAGGQSQMI